MTLRVVAYVRAPEQEGVPGRSAYSRGLRAIEDWAAACGAVVTSLAVEPAASGLDGAGDRVGFLRALTLVRQEEADVICVPSLHEMDPDMVVQEFLLAEAGFAVASASALDNAALEDPPRDEVRAAVRRAIAQLPAFQGEMRALRAWARRAEGSESLEEIGPAMAALESLQDEGRWEQIAGGGRPHRLAALLRFRRTRRTSA